MKTDQECEKNLIYLQLWRFKNGKSAIKYGMVGNSSNTLTNRINQELYDGKLVKKIFAFVRTELKVDKIGEALSTIDTLVSVVRVKENYAEAAEEYIKSMVVLPKLLDFASEQNKFEILLFEPEQEEEMLKALHMIDNCMKQMQDNERISHFKPRYYSSADFLFLSKESRNKLV